VAAKAKAPRTTQDKVRQISKKAPTSPRSRTIDHRRQRASRRTLVARTQGPKATKNSQKVEKYVKRRPYRRSRPYRDWEPHQDIPERLLKSVRGRAKSVRAKKESSPTQYTSSNKLSRAQLVAAVLKTLSTPYECPIIKKHFPGRLRVNTNFVSRLLVSHSKSNESADGSRKRTNPAKPPTPKATAPTKVIPPASDSSSDSEPEKKKVAFHDQPSTSKATINPAFQKDLAALIQKHNPPPPSRPTEDFVRSVRARLDRIESHIDSIRLELNKL